MSNYVHVEDMTWPGHWDDKDIERRMRHDHENVTHADLCFAASVMAAYRELIECSEQKRRLVVREIRKQTPEVIAGSEPLRPVPPKAAPLRPVTITKGAWNTKKRHLDI